jgi:outer membrane murein-binding lipoprotein Lpp
MRDLRATSALVLAAAALGLPLAGCGKDKPKLPRSDSRSITRLLRQVDSRARRKKCDELAASTIPTLEARVSTLSPTIDADIRATLRDGVDNLRSLVTLQCTGVKPEPPTTSVETQTPTLEPPPSTTTTTTTTPSTTTHTKPPTTQPPTTQPPTTSPSGGSPGGGQNNGGGAGAGGGNGK